MPTPQVRAGVGLMSSQMQSGSGTGDLVMSLDTDALTKAMTDAVIRHGEKMVAECTLAVKQIREALQAIGFDVENSKPDELVTIALNLALSNSMVVPEPEPVTGSAYEDFKNFKAKYVGKYEQLQIPEEASEILSTYDVQDPITGQWVQGHIVQHTITIQLNQYRPI
jgi:hypothetical protein